jgi:hypothetical protein
VLIRLSGVREPGSHLPRMLKAGAHRLTHSIGKEKLSVTPIRERGTV